MRSVARSVHAERLLLCAMPVALLAGGWMIAKLTVENLLYHDAAATGRGWATYLAANIKDLDQIVAGHKPSADSQRLFDSVQKVGQVFRYVIYDPEGRLRLVSDDLDDDEDEDKDLAQHNPAVVRSIASGNPVVNIEDGLPPTRPPYFAEAYVPVVVGGTTIAVVETYVDQTEKREAYRHTLVLTSVSLLVLIGVAFGIPALAWQRRSREKRDAEAHIHFLAHHDAGTGLINRHRLASLVAGLLSERARSHSALALHAIDIDQFKDVNDTFGHDAGDALIAAVAERLGALAGARDYVARVGGNEFVILQTEVTEGRSPLAFAETIVRNLARRFHVNGHELAITASVGVAAFPLHGNDFTRLMKSADLALDRSKAGHNCASLFSSDMDRELAERLRLERILRDRVESNSFELHYQPVVQMPARRLVGFEALVRMRDETGAIIPPTAFIALAERLGLIDAIGTWVLKEACLTAAGWPGGLKVAVNLSPAQLTSGRLAQTVAATLAESGLDPTRLELEVTEGMLLDDGENVMAELRKLKALKVGIVMDDFGTGYSSLSYLWKFPFDKIKIDRAFMLALDEDSNSEASTIVKTIIDLGRSLNVTVTVEGVENDRQVDFVDAARCDQIQGYYFGRPLPAAKVAAHIAGALDPPPAGVVDARAA